MNSKPINLLTTLVFSVLSVVAFISLLLFSLFNQLIADDVAYFRYFQDGTPWGFLHWHYFEHSGRFLQSIFVAIGYVLFGDASVKIMPIFILLLFVAATSWGLYRFLPWKSKPMLYSILSGLLLSSTATLLMPSTYDSYLWWTSSSIYLTSIVVLVINISIVDILVKKTHSKVGGWLLFIPLILGQTLSEITALIMTASAGLLLLYCIIRKSHERIIIFTKVVAALLLGFLITYLSPGSITRRSSDDGSNIGFDFIRIFVLSTRHTFELIASLSVWEFTLLGTIGILVGLSIKRLTKKKVRGGLALILLVTFIGIYGSFCINNYVWYNMPLRAYTLPSFILTIAIVAIFAIVTNRIYHKYQNKFFVIALTSAIIALFGILSLVGMVRYTSSFTNFMIVRDAAYNERESAIKKRLQNPGHSVDVESLPILVKSEATDLIYGADNQVSWYETALKGENDIPTKTRVNVIAPPDSYCTFGESNQNICTPRGDNTLFRKALTKLNNFMLYYFSLNY